MTTIFDPIKLGDIELANRIIMAPLTRCRADEGRVPNALMAEYYVQRASAGLILSEATSVTPMGVGYPDTPGIWSNDQVRGWTNVTKAVHAAGGKIVLQLWHVGRVSHPSYLNGEAPVAPSAIQPKGHVSLVRPLADFPTPRALETAEIADIVDAYRTGAENAKAAGFDGVEIHGANGYLLDQFLQSSTNQRTDRYGGSLENRCRYPLRVFAAMRAAWPAHKPMSVRISAHDWVAGGITPDDAVQIARLFKAAGADMIDCSSGQVSKREKPVYGRMFQTPFADRIRNEAGIGAIAVGAIYEADHANSIIAAGRADLCAVARPHLANPAWTLSEAARIGYTGPVGLAWPQPYLAGKQQLERNLERERQMAAASSGLTPQQVAAKLLEG